MASSLRLDEKFMRLAIRKALLGIGRGQTPFGACVVKGGKTISCCHNGVWGGTDITAHAEMRAIRLACRKLRSISLKGSAIYSTCEPCPMCFSAIHWAGIRRIAFGAPIKDARACGFSELGISNKKMARLGKTGIGIKGGVLRRECAALFSAFSEKNKGKKLY